jgi:hypothetical protein
MVVRQEKPMNAAGQAPKGRLTWMAIAGMAVFVILLVFLFVKPGTDERSGAGTEPPAAPGAPTDASPPPGSQPAG